MGLRTTILASPETMSDLAWAAEQRYREASGLLEAKQYSGSIYLFGLAAEMWLKLASSKLLRMSPAVPTTGFLGPVKAWMRLNAPMVQPESYHSLLFWSEHLILRRAFLGVPLTALLAGQLRHHVINRLFEDWKIEVRYRQVAVSQRDAWRVYNDTTWVRQSWNHLWR